MNHTQYQNNYVNFLNFSGSSVIIFVSSFFQKEILKLIFLCRVKILLHPQMVGHLTLPLPLLRNLNLLSLRLHYVPLITIRVPPVAPLQPSNQFTSQTCRLPLPFPLLRYSSHHTRPNPLRSCRTRTSDGRRGISTTSPSLTGGTNWDREDSASCIMDK